MVNIGMRLYKYGIILEMYFYSVLQQIYHVLSFTIQVLKCDLIHDSGVLHTWCVRLLSIQSYVLNTFH